MKLGGRVALSELSIRWNVVFVPDVLESGGTSPFVSQQGTGSMKVQKKAGSHQEKRRNYCDSARVFLKGFSYILL